MSKASCLNLKPAASIAAVRSYSFEMGRCPIYHFCRPHVHMHVCILVRLTAHLSLCMCSMCCAETWQKATREDALCPCSSLTPGKVWLLLICSKNTSWMIQSVRSALSPGSSSFGICHTFAKNLYGHINSTLAIHFGGPLKVAITPCKGHQPSSTILHSCSRIRHALVLQILLHMPQFELESRTPQHNQQ